MFAWPFLKFDWPLILSCRLLQSTQSPLMFMCALPCRQFHLFLQLEMLTFAQHQYRLVHIVHWINSHGLVTLYDRENYLCFQHFLLWGPCRPYLFNFGLSENSPHVMYKGSPLSFPNPIPFTLEKTGNGTKNFYLWRKPLQSHMRVCMMIDNHNLHIYIQPRPHLSIFQANKVLWNVWHPNNGAAGRKLKQWNLHLVTWQ